MPELNQVTHNMAQSIRNEQGYVTIITVLGVLLLLTVVSLSMMSTSINDQQIVRNDKLNKRNFYFAESAANEAAQAIENAATSIVSPTAGLAWVVQTSKDYFENSDYWRDASNNYSWYTVGSFVVSNIKIPSVPSGNFYGLANPAVANSNQNYNSSNLEVFDSAGKYRDDIHYAANFSGVANKSSVKVTNSSGRLYAFEVFGMFSNHINKLGEALVEEGYRKRF